MFREKVNILDFMRHEGLVVYIWTLQDFMLWRSLFDKCADVERRLVSDKSQVTDTAEACFWNSNWRGVLDR